jgi:hypothetical protein
MIIKVQEQIEGPIVCFASEWGIYYPNLVRKKKSFPSTTMDN